MAKNIEPDQQPLVEMMNGVEDAYCQIVDGPISLNKAEEHFGYLEPREANPIKLMPMLIPMSSSEPDSIENPCIPIPVEPIPEDQEELLDPDVTLHYYEFENLTFSRHNKVVNLKKL